MSLKAAVQKISEKKRSSVFDRYKKDILESIEEGYSQRSIIEALISINGVSKGLTQQNLSQWLKRQNSKPAASAGPIEKTTKKADKKDEDEVSKGDDEPAAAKPKSQADEWLEIIAKNANDDDSSGDDGISRISSPDDLWKLRTN